MKRTQKDPFENIQLKETFPGLLKGTILGKV